jgi:ArsR family transcriptional regulator
MLRALAEPERLRIVQCLRSGPRSVSELAAHLGHAEIAKVSHHLSVLRQAGLVEDEKRGRFVIYRLHPSVFRAEAGDLLDLGCCRLEIPSEGKKEED